MSNKIFKHFILNSPTDIQECDEDTYLEWHQQQDAEDQTVLAIRLRYTRLMNGVRISTIFRGDDAAGYDQNNKPYLYETRVADPDYFNMHAILSVSHEKALKLHETVIQQIQKHYKLYEEEVHSDA